MLLYYSQPPPNPQRKLSAWHFLPKKKNVQKRWFSILNSCEFRIARRMIYVWVCLWHAHCVGHFCQYVKRAMNSRVRVCGIGFLYATIWSIRALALLQEVYSETVSMWLCQKRIASNWIYIVKVKNACVNVIQRNISSASIDWSQRPTWKVLFHSFSSSLKPETKKNSYFSPCNRIFGILNLKNTKNSLFSKFKLN